MAKPTLETIAEATQIGAGEFYQVMSEGIQSNYPVTTGLMPWVYKRPWPVVAAINLVDGMGQPSATYYFLKRTYEPTHVLLNIKHLLWAPGEAFPISINVLNGVDRPSFKGVVQVKILDDSFREVWQASENVNVPEGTSVLKEEIGTYAIPHTYREKYFFVIVSLTDEYGKVISHAEYWPRTIKLMEDEAYYQKFVSEPIEWPTMENGPWLKPTVAKHKTSVGFKEVKLMKKNGNKGRLHVVVTNKGRLPSFMTNLNIEDVSRSFYANDNFFWLAPGETKSIEIDFELRESQVVSSMKLVLSSWNAKTQSRMVKLVD